MNNFSSCYVKVQYWTRDLLITRSTSLCLVHTTRWTKLPCLVRLSGVNRIGDKSRLFSVVLNIFETEQFCPVLSVLTRLLTSPSCKLQTGSREDKRLFTPLFKTGERFKIFCCRQCWLVANSVHTADTDKTRQFYTSVVWTMHYKTSYLPIQAYWQQAEKKTKKYTIA